MLRRAWTSRRPSTESVLAVPGLRRKQRCLNCSCIFTDGANTSHSCIYHPGERGADNRWTCCRRRCTGGRLVDGCLADFHRYSDKAVLRTPGLVPWATMPSLGAPKTTAAAALAAAP